MFLPTGEATEAVDVMQHIWSGHWPEFRSPQLKGLWLAGKTAWQNVHLQSGQNYPARVLAQSPAGSALAYAWEIMEESGAKSTGGDFESPPQSLPGLVSAGAAEVQVKAPAKPGAYRLFVYARDGHDEAAYANIPFYVDAKAPAVAAQP
jgi:hypothetical protein